jgi:hypothetical protein
VGEIRNWVGLAAGLLLLGGTGCFEPSPEAVARLAQVQQNGKEMDEALDTMEERLLGNQASVKLWGEMAERSKSVTQVACSNSTFHQVQIAELAQKQVEKKRKIRRGQLAKADQGVGGPVLSRSVRAPKRRK